MIQLRTASTLTSSTISSAKPLISSRRASLGGDATRTQVVQRGVVELADRGAVLARDLVGEDLEAGLGVDLGPVRQQQVVVGLFGVGAVGTRATSMPPLNTPVLASSSTPRNIWRLVQSLARCDHRDLLIEDLLADTEEQPGQVGMRTGTGQLDVVGKPTVGRAEVERPGAQRAALALDDLDPTEVHLLGREILDEDVFERGVVGERDAGANVRPAELGADPEPGLDHGGRAAGAEVDDDAGARSVRRRAGHGDVDDVDRCVDLDAGVDHDDAPSVP